MMVIFFNIVIEKSFSNKKSSGFPEDKQVYHIKRFLSSLLVIFVKKRILKLREEVIKLAEAKEKPIGKITHYYSKIGVGIIELSDTLKVGEKIKIKGHSTDFDQTVDSIQIDHKEVEEAKKGDVVGMKVNDKVREEDEVFKAE